MLVSQADNLKIGLAYNARVIVGGTRRDEVRAARRNYPQSVEIFLYCHRLFLDVEQGKTFKSCPRILFY